MMKTLIIYAHPNKEGHNGIMLKEIISQLKRRKTSYEIIDLYKINYDPIMKKEELYNDKNKIITKQNKKFQEQIKKTNNLIFIYPVLWSSMPAILKGWIDRVFTSPFAFKYIRKPIISKIIKESIPVPMLKGKKAAVFITTGVKKWQGTLILKNRFKKTISKDILNFVGIKNKVFHLGKCTKITKQKKQEIKRLVNEGINYLNP